MRSFEVVAERPGSRPALPLAAVERSARPVSARHARRRLLATSSALALVGTAALFGIAALRPAAACTIDVTGPGGPISNAGNIDCINIHGAVVTGNVSNTGTLGSLTTGITVTNSTINGEIQDTGTILGGIRNNNGSTINSASSAISIGAVSTFAGGITNSGTIIGIVGDGIVLNGATRFSGGISNSGSIAVSAFGIVIVNTTSFSGGISNSGTISSAHGFGVIIQADSLFSGGIANSGTISGHTTALYIHLVSTFTGGITNSGLVSGPLGIVVSGSGGGGSIVTSLFSGSVSNSGTISAVHAGVLVTGVAQFGDSLGGGITNSGTVSVSAGTSFGVDVSNVSTFGGAIGNSGTISAGRAGINVTNVAQFGDSLGGGITNSGTITARSVGILVSRVAQFGSSAGGGISNSGTISVGHSGVGIGVSAVQTFIGGITNSGTIKVGASGAGIIVDAGSFFGNVSNSGTITGAHTGIVICDCSILENGAVVNSGVISASTSAIDASTATSAITIDQMAGTITGNILLPTTAGVVGNVNIFGGTINGNIVGASGANDTINFNLGAGTFTYASAFGFSNINQVNINSGTVVLNGANSATTVNVFGTLAGTGSIDPTTVTIDSGGTLSPGTSASPLGTFGITGALVFNAGSFYAITISPGGSNSNTAVTGTATLGGNGTVVVTPQLGHYSAGQVYQILTTTGGLTGQFAGLTVNGSFTGSIALDYATTPGNVDLDITTGGFSLLTPPSGLNQNQQNVVNGINNAILNNDTLPPGFANLGNISGPSLLNALTALSGETATGAQQSADQLMNDFLNLMLDPTAGGGSTVSGGGATPFAPEQDASLPSDVALAYAKALKAPQPQSSVPQNFDQRWTAWGSAFGGRNWTKGDPVVGSNNVNASDFGFAAGMDYHATPNLIYGFGLAGGGTNWNLAQGLGSGRSDSFQAGVYAKSHWGPAYVSGALAFANHWFTTDRIALGDQLRASFTGQSYAARLEGGYRYAVPITGAIVGVTPYAALQAQDFHTPSYSETDLSGGGFGLSYASMNATDTRSELGARFDNLQVVRGMPLVLRGRLAWAHDWFTNSAALNAVFEALPGSNFTVNGAAPPKNSALTTAAAELHINANWTAIAKFDGDFAPGSQTYGSTGTLRYSW